MFRKICEIIFINHIGFISLLAEKTGWDGARVGNRFLQIELLLLEDLYLLHKWVDSLHRQCRSGWVGVRRQTYIFSCTYYFTNIVLYIFLSIYL